MSTHICVTCGVQFAESSTPPAHCPICEDERQYIGHAGQQWTTLAELRQSRRNIFYPVAPGITGISSEPRFAIGQQAFLFQTPTGNLLWECVSLIDDETIAQVQALGGITAIAISHPHFYSSMVEWAQRFDAPVYLHAANRPFVMRLDPVLRFWSEEHCMPLPGLTVIRCGGHFPGSSVLHWATGADGRGALFTGDTVYVVADRRWVSFMYSYPNLVPLAPHGVRQIVNVLEPFAFDQVYSSWRDNLVPQDGKAAVQRSAERIIRHMEGRVSYG
jgi:glyoxylase-like metal-dependent hydrolase (beta-lactamase superfamily II)